MAKVLRPPPLNILLSLAVQAVEMVLVVLLMVVLAVLAVLEQRLVLLFLLALQLQ
jgi:hypothetical protein